MMIDLGGWEPPQGWIQNGMKNFTGKGWKKRLFDKAEYFLRDATK